MEMIRINEFSFVIASDLKLLNVILGLSSHGGKYACVYCEAEVKDLTSGRLHTFGRLAECYNGFVNDVMI